MLLLASTVLTLALKFDSNELPDSQLQLVQTTDTHTWQALDKGFTDDQPYGLALTPSNGQQLHFAVREYNANCIHNGVVELPTSIDELQKPTQANYRITGATCAYADLNFAGKVEVNVQRQTQTTSAKPAQTSFKTQALSEAPWRPQPPQSDPSVYGWFASNAQGQIKAHYSSNPELAVPAYSISKTFIAALATLLYRQQFDAEILQHSMNHWGAICPQATWQEVTVGDALNMRTGHYNSLNHSADESSAAMIANFFDVFTHKAKLEHACAYPKQAQQKVVYQTSATYLAATALTQALNATKYNSISDYLYATVWPQLQLSPLAYSIDTTKDEAQQVWGGYGLTLLPSDLVKLANFIQQDPLQLGFKTILTMPNQAYSVPHQSNLRYRQSIWFWQHPDTQKWYPFLSGYGGIIVLFLDAQHTYYMVSDQHDHRFKSIIDDFEKYQLAP